ncbi:small GTP-binding protein [Plasmodium cynomolgi strain B]|uniref:Small GTP-binding protein n=1 Tax=Plasmodium cynomolgi (strain B) TaxID=1120755 RepID=K6UER1_PLACD|nr:small GTP-binding protein [Plasmodium cynomolgi strain B]GAB68791.1 small GTP-binding protein [Plasmodium cynomolgi strain B]
MITLCYKLLYKGKFIPVGRRIFREKLISGRKQKSPIILLPPYITIHELRLMLNINYDTCFKAANVYKSGNVYKWKDSEDRTFQSVNKRNVIIPYSTAAYVSKIFKFKPRLIQVELFCEEEEKSSGTLQDVYRKVYLAEEYHENCSYDPPSLPPNERRTQLEDKKKSYYTVVSVIGHINHGKTTMLDKMTNNNLALSEAGCITQNIKPIHFEHGPFKFTFVDTPGHKVFQIFRGRAAFLSDILIILISLEVGAEIQTEEAIKYADKFGIPVIFVLNKADLYGENESIVKAELRKQCTNMYDDGNLKHNFSKEIENAIAISSLTGYNLDKLINRLFFISHYIDLPYHSVNRFYNTCEAIRDADLGVGNSLGGGNSRDNPPDGDTSRDNAPHGNTPHGNPPREEKTHPSMHNTEKAKERRKSDLNLLQKYIRKSDCLLAIDKNPMGMGMVVDVSKDSSKGTVLHVIVRNGFFIEGSYFICGSAYGKIQKMYKFNSNFKESCSYAGIGMAVLISGIKKHGNATTDDLIFTLPQSNAFRLCQYRLMVEKLATLQVTGKEIKVSWENDMKKNEFHAEDIYQNRLAMSDKRKAIEEFGIEKENIFEDVSVREFHKSNTQRKKEEEEEEEEEEEGEEEEEESVVIQLEEENKYEDLSRVKKKKIQTILSQGDSNESILVPEEKNTFCFFESPKGGEQLDALASSYPGGGSHQEKDQTNSPSGAPNINPLTYEQREAANGITNETNNHVPSRCYNTESATLYEHVKGGKKEDVHEGKGKTHPMLGRPPLGRGRKSRHAQDSSATNGQSSQEAADSHREPYNDEKKLNDPWYYEESEETWAKKVLKRNDELMETWRNKTRQREIEKERQIFYEKQMILKNEILRRKLLGEEKLTEEEINAYLYDEQKSNANNSQASSSAEPIELPAKNCPVIPIIIRTNYVGMFDIFLDEFENLQKIYNVKISVVHGGIGPITPNDVVHAEVESNFGYCCIYAFQVKVLPDSVKQSVLSNIVIKQFDVFTDLIDDVVNRIKNIKALIAHNMYVRSLKNERTQEGV